jgi:integrase
MPREALVASIRERVWTGADGVERRAWQASFTDQAGKRRARQFRLKKNADDWLTTARGQVQTGTFTADSTSVTVAVAAQLWLERGEREGLEPATMAAYRSHVRYHVGPLLGAARLSRLTRPMVEQFADDLLAGGRSRPLAKKVLQSLKAIVGEAQRRGLVAQNVATGVTVKLAGRHARKAMIPTRAEVKVLLDKATGRARPLLVLAVFTGMRASEIRGLRWTDVDLDNRVVRVRQRADASGRIGSLKSASSRRDIPMSPMLANTLKAWRLQIRGKLVFPGRHDGRPIAHMTLREALGRAHQLRHFFASWLIDQGFGPKRVQALMGHSSIAITFDVYGHLFPQESDHAKFAAGELALIG